MLTQMLRRADRDALLDMPPNPTVCTVRRAQLGAVLLNCLTLFVLMFGTYLFQVGLIGVLFAEFKAILYILPTYFLVLGAHAGIKIVSTPAGRAKGAAAHARMMPIRARLTPPYAPCLPRSRLRRNCWRLTS